MKTTEQLENEAGRLGEYFLERELKLPYAVATFSLFLARMGQATVKDESLRLKQPAINSIAEMLIHAVSAFPCKEEEPDHDTT